MGILDKIMFWRKKDEFADIGLGENENLAFGDEFGAAPGTGLGPTPGTGPGGPGLGAGMGPRPSPGPTPFPSAGPSMPSYPQPQYQQPSYSPQQDLESKNLEIISSKLDALRATLQSLDQRLANIEAIARGEQEEPRRRRYY